MQHIWIFSDSVLKLLDDEGVRFALIARLACDRGSWLELGSLITKIPDRCNLVDEMIIARWC
jgi:hypothetical protein